MFLLHLCDRRQGQHIPAPLRQHVTHEVLLVQALHHDNYGSPLLVVEATDNQIVTPRVRRLESLLGESVFQPVRIVDHDKVSAAPCQGSAD